MKLVAILLTTTCIAVSQDAPRPRIVALAHISLLAHDFEKSRAFYHDFLGYEEPYSLKNPDGSPSMTFFKVNDHQYIELAPEKVAGSDRLNHIAFEVEDAEAMRRYLGAHGVTVPEHVPKGRIGNLNFMIKDPEGHSVEIVQYGPDSWTKQQWGQDMTKARISDHMMHAGFVVTNLAAEIRFYTDVLGFREFWRGSSNGSVLSWINLRLPDSEDYIEFMLFKDAPPPDKRGTANHLCLRVPDGAAAIAALNAKPYRAQYAREIEMHVGKNHKHQVNLYDPDGTRTELMEPNTIDGKPAPSSDAPSPVPESTR